MKISIITVVYNNQATIAHAIESVIQQSYKNIEYIIIDGASTDNTLSIINKYKEKISIIISEPDTGIYDAMNKGISKASGDIIGILNSDDFYQDKEVISDILNCFKKNSEIDILYGNLVYVSYENTDKVIRKWRSKKYFDNFFEDGNVPPHPSFFLRKQVYDKVGLFNVTYKLAADYEFMLRAIKVYKCKSLYLDRLMVRMRLGGASNKSLKNILKANTEVLRSWRENNLKIPYLLMPKRFIKKVNQFIK